LEVFSFVYGGDIIERPSNLTSVEWLQADLVGFTVYKDPFFGKTGSAEFNDVIEARIISIKENDSILERLSQRGRILDVKVSES
jgi:hypothetical protein